MTPGTERIKGRLQESIELGLQATPVDVVVMGPSLAETTPAARLRSAIIESARECGATIEPEHAELIKIAAAEFGDGHQLTVYEMHLVKISHLTVLIPASPGSLCELGLFASSLSLGPKLLVLASTEFPRSGTYVADGPLTAAKHNGAEVILIDYEDLDTAWSHVRRRIERIRAGLNMVHLAGGS